MSKSLSYFERTKQADIAFTVLTFFPEINIKSSENKTVSCKLYIHLLYSPVHSTSKGLGHEIKIGYNIGMVCFFKNYCPVPNPIYGWLSVIRVRGGGVKCLLNHSWTL